MTHALTANEYKRIMAQNDDVAVLSLTHPLLFLLYSQANQLNSTKVALIACQMVSKPGL